MRNFLNLRRPRLRALWVGAAALSALVPIAAQALDLPSLPNPFGGAETPQQEAGKPAPPAELACPEIQIVGGSPELRAPPGADAASVKYQLMVGEMARECQLAGETLSIKVGVEGAAVLGPTGQPGSYYGNLRVALMRMSDNGVVGAKTYRVGGVIAAGHARAEFRLVADPISVAYTPKAVDDYYILVSFVSGGDAEAIGGKPRARGKRR